MIFLYVNHTGDNPAAYGQFIGTYSQPLLAKLKTLLEKEKDEVKACMENLFTSAGILKKWAHEEQKYCEETISYTNEKIQSLECTIAALNDKSEAQEGICSSARWKKEK